MFVYKKTLASSVSTDLRYQDFTIIYDNWEATLSCNWKNIFLQTLKTIMVLDRGPTLSHLARQCFWELRTQKNPWACEK